MTNPIPTAAIEAGAKARAEARGTDWENLKHTFPGMAKNIRTETRATLKAAIPELLDENQRLSQRVTRLSNLERRNAKQRDEARARLAAVEKWHQPLPYYDVPTKYYCKECGPNHSLYPCRTIKAVRGD